MNFGSRRTAQIEHGGQNHWPRKRPASQTDRRTDSSHVQASQECGRIARIDLKVIGRINAKNGSKSVG